MAGRVNITVKVSKETAERMERAAKAHNMKSSYAFLQSSVAMALMLLDPEGGDLSPEQRSMCERLKRMVGSADFVNSELARVKPHSRTETPTEVVAYFGRSCLFLRNINAEGDYTATTNIQTALELALSKALPSAVMRNLKSYQRENGYGSILDVVIELITQAENGALGREVQEMFDVAGEADPRRVKLGLSNKTKKKPRKKYGGEQL